jgi:hypothetical protein
LSRGISGAAERGKGSVNMMFCQVYLLDQQNGASNIDAAPVILGKLSKLVILLVSFLIKQRL